MALESDPIEAAKITKKSRRSSPDAPAASPSTPAPPDVSAVPVVAASLEPEKVEPAPASSKADVNRGRDLTIANTPRGERVFVPPPPKPARPPLKESKSGWYVVVGVGGAREKIVSVMTGMATVRVGMNFGVPTHGQKTIDMLNEQGIDLEPLASK